MKRFLFVGFLFLFSVTAVFAGQSELALSPQQKEALIVSLADQFHADWQKFAREVEGKKDRYKVAEDKDGNAFKAKTTHPGKDIKAYMKENGIPRKYRSKFRYQEGSLFEDILAMPNRYLAPNNQFSSSASAIDVVGYVLENYSAGKPFDDAFVEEASDKLHERWKERNSWASAEQKLPFNELSPVEAEKDRILVRTGIRFVRAVMGNTEGDLATFTKEVSDKIQYWRAPKNELPSDTVAEIKKIMEKFPNPEKKFEVISTIVEASKVRAEQSLDALGRILRSHSHVANRGAEDEAFLETYKAREMDILPHLEKMGKWAASQGTLDCVVVLK